MTDLYYRDKFRNRTNLKNIRIFDTLGRLDDLSSILQKASAKFKIFPYLKNDLKESQLINKSKFFKMFTSGSMSFCVLVLQKK